MENPDQDIEDIILTLCTRPHAEQRAALDRYFTPNAEFVHPLCRVPAFGPGPADHAAPGARLGSRQVVAAVFRWYKILSPHIELGIESVAWDRDHGTLFVALHQRFALWFVPLYAAHVRLVTELRLVRGDDSGDGGADGDGSRPPRYYIARQEDHYQINEVVKFFSLGLGAALWTVVQLLATLACVGGVLVVDTALGLVRGQRAVKL